MEVQELILPFVGGLGMFIYGMQIMAQGLENAAGTKMKSLLGALTRNKLLGVLLGAFITAVIQSSSATTVMVVGFVNASIMNLTQAISVIMGANIGTTVTGWLVSAGEWAKFFTPSTLAPLAIIVGVIILLSGKRNVAKEFAGIVIGFGLLFVGISTMSDAVAPLRTSESFRNIFVMLGGKPLFGILAGAFVTAVIQSSSASVGILQSLAAVGLVPFQTAIYIIMGQNIGTCVTALLSSVGAKKTAKTAALMHLLFNIIGTFVFSGIIILYFTLVKPAWGYGAITQTQISLIHTIFNIGTTILLFPVSGWIVLLAKKLGQVTDEDLVVKEISLDDRMLQTPPLAIQATTTELGHVGSIVKESLELSQEVLFTADAKQIQKIQENESRVDELCATITAYAVKISALPISEKENEYIAGLLQVVSDIERVSDHCENFAESACDLAKQKLHFSKNEEKELKEVFRLGLESFCYAMDGFMNDNAELSCRAIQCEEAIDKLELQLRANHIKRLAANECNRETGIVFIDTLIGLERVSDHARNIAESIYSSIM